MSEHTIHEELEAIARAMSSRSTALRQIAEELTAIAEAPLKPLCAEGLARELIKLDLCLVHKDVVKAVVDYLHEVEKDDGGYSFDTIDTAMPAAVDHLKQALIGH